MYLGFFFFFVVKQGNVFLCSLFSLELFCAVFLLNTLTQRSCLDLKGFLSAKGMGL